MWSASSEGSSSWAGEWDFSSMYRIRTRLHIYWLGANLCSADGNGHALIVSKGEKLRLQQLAGLGHCAWENAALGVVFETHPPPNNAVNVSYRSSQEQCERHHASCGR
jgi:hypothetical protein